MTKPRPILAVVPKKCQQCPADATPEHRPFCEACHKKVQDKFIAAVRLIGGAR